MRSKVMRKLAIKEKDQDHLLGSGLVIHQDGRNHLHIIKTCQGGLTQCRRRVILILTTCHGGETPPMFNHMPLMQYNQGWGGPRRPAHERLSLPNNDRFYAKNRANEEKREGKHLKVETRTSEVITIKVGSHDVPIYSGDEVGESSSNKSEAGTSSSQSAGLTRPSGRSDRAIRLV